MDKIEIIRSALVELSKTLVLVGLMGAWKTAIGKRLALRLNLPFKDVDQEIEMAAGCSVVDFFEKYGEAEFRHGERRVLSRLLCEGAGILATGGGAFMDADTRTEILEQGISIWLKADIETLWKRVCRRETRPLLKTSCPRQTLSQLLVKRYPVYAEADITIISTDSSLESTVDDVIVNVAAIFDERRHGQ